MRQELSDAVNLYEQKKFLMIPLIGKKPPDNFPTGQNHLGVATLRPSQVAVWAARWKDMNLGIVTGPESGLLVLDIDGSAGEDSLRDLETSYGELPDTPMVLTGKGRHYYFKYPGRPIKNSAGKVGPGIDVRAAGGYVVAPPSIHPETGKSYEWELTNNIENVETSEVPAWLLHLIDGTPVISSSEPVGEEIPEGKRNPALTSIAGSLRRAGLAPGELLETLNQVNEKRCIPPLPAAEVATIAGSIGRKAPGQIVADPEKNDETETAVAWPAPMEEAAYYGLAGRIANAIAPETEAAREAILMNILCAFGAIIGRGPSIQAGGVRHGCNLFACLTGGTSKGRKGSSWGPVERLFNLVDEIFIREKTPGGLSTGEGLIWTVRDDIYRPKKQKRGEYAGGDIEMEIEIPGVPDKRLLLIESELGQVLQVLKREGNTLSPILRQAWDGKECLQSLTKAIKGKTTGAHISLVGHVTKDELTQNFASVELLNGLGNRILWVCVRRSRLLPEGGNIPDLALYANELTDAITFAKSGPQVEKSDATKRLWEKVYPLLTEDRAGLWGAATARAEAQVIRLAMIYALLDSTDTISPDHLKAALAVWGFCEDSARFIFSGQAEDPVIEKILKLLESGPKTQTEINDAFGGHIASKILRAKIETLSAKGRVDYDERKTAGRPIKEWKLNAKK